MKNCNLLIDELFHFFSEEFECTSEDNYLILNTPFVYSDGDHIQLFIQKYENLFVISDLGETARKMDSYNFNWNTAQIKNLYSHLLKTYDVESENHILQIKINSFEGMGYKIFNLLQAIQKKENYLILRKTFKQRNFQEMVQEYLLNEGFQPEAEYKIAGASGIEYTIDFFINHNSNILLKTLSTQSDSGDNDQISRIYSSYSDIHINHPYLRRTIFLDDLETKWNQYQINLITQVSDTEIGKWSQRELFSKNLHSLIRQ
jgi:hypothetical protein